MESKSFFKVTPGKRAVIHKKDSAKSAGESYWKNIAADLRKVRLKSLGR